MSRYHTLEQAAQQLSRGAVIAYPTEAVFGLGCLPTCNAAVDKILQLKGRKPNQGLIVIAAAVEQLQSLIALSPEEITKITVSSWPGPHTWVFPASELAPKRVRGLHNTVAVRVTAHPTAAALCKLAGPLVSTSANPHSMPPAKSAQEVADYFGAQIDAILDGPVDPNLEPTPIRSALDGTQIR